MPAHPRQVRASFSSSGIETFPSTCLCKPDVTWAIYLKPSMLTRLVLPYLIWVWEFLGCFLGVIALNWSSSGSLEDQKLNSLQSQLDRQAKGPPPRRPLGALGDKSIVAAVLNLTCYHPPVTWPSPTAPRWSHSIPQWQYLTRIISEAYKG